MANSGEGTRNPGDRSPTPGRGEPNRESPRRQVASRSTTPTRRQEQRAWPPSGDPGSTPSTLPMHFMHGPRPPFGEGSSHSGTRGLVSGFGFAGVGGQHNVNPLAVAVGGSGGGVASGAIPMQVSPQRKRGREGDAGAGSSGGGARLPVVPAVENPQDPPQRYRCSICGREFQTPKGLFGHMRSHPDRGWRGAYPPPVFNRNEFDNLLNQGEAAGGNAGGGGDEAEPGNNQAAEQAADYRVPDLNNPPPPDSGSE